MMSEILIILGHGSRREEANEEIKAIYNLVKKANPTWQVSYAFVEFAHPSLEERVRELVKMGKKTIVLTPVFLTVGNHLAQGLPKRFRTLEEENPGLKLVMAKHLGADPLIAQLVSKRSAEALAELKENEYDRNEI